MWTKYLYLSRFETFLLRIHVILRDSPDLKSEKLERKQQKYYQIHRAITAYESLGFRGLVLLFVVMVETTL